MKINFEEIQEKTIPHFKDGNKEVNARIVDDGKAKIMKMRLEPGASIGLHSHTENAEVIFIISGTGTAITDGVSEKVSAGEAVYCPKGHSHTLINDGSAPLTFNAVVM